MPTIAQIFDEMDKRYIKGRARRPRTYYFSIGDFKATVKVTPEAVTVERGKTVENADCVLKTTPEIFERMVLKGKLPGVLDIARGKVKTNDPGALKELRDLFDFSGV
jgi:long-chain acyl-CoA synthetase